MEILFVVCAVIRKNEEFLICRRSQKKSHPGKWEFPGGKIEQTEEPLEALKRELQEELELSAENYTYLMESECVVNDIKIRLMAYQCDYISGAHSSSDHDRLEWVSRSALKDYTFTNPDIPIVQFIESQAAI